MCKKNIEMTKNMCQSFVRTSSFRIWYIPEATSQENTQLHSRAHIFFSNGGKEEIISIIWSEFTCKHTLLVICVGSYCRTAWNFSNKEMSKRKRKRERKNTATLVVVVNNVDWLQHITIVIKQFKQNNANAIQGIWTIAMNKVCYDLCFSSSSFSVIQSIFESDIKHCYSHC